jgi:hypothetical protein
MKLKLQEKYLPVDYEEVLFEELLLLRQGHLSVEEFTNKFHELSIRSRILETRQTIARYKASLREDIKKELLTVRLVSIEEAYQLALRVEQQLRNSTTRRTFQGWNNPPSRSSTTAASRTAPSVLERLPVRGGQLANCTTVEREDPKGKAAIHNRPERGKEECYRCDGRGHYTVVCPTREQKFTMICRETDPQVEADEYQPTPTIQEDLIMWKYPRKFWSAPSYHCVSSEEYSLDRRSPSLRQTTGSETTSFILELSIMDEH